MSQCCGKKRQMLQRTLSKRSEVPSIKPILQNPITIAHHGNFSHMEIGKITGTIYLFSAHDQGLPVDERDAPILLINDAFQRTKDS